MDKYRRYNQLNVTKHRSHAAKSEKGIIKAKKNLFNRDRPKPHRNLPKYPNLISGRLTTQHMPFFKGGLTSETIYRKTAENSIAKAVEDNDIQTCLATYNRKKQIDDNNYYPTNSSVPSLSAKFETMPKDVTLNSSECSADKKSSSPSSKSCSCETPKRKNADSSIVQHSRSTFKQINDAYCKLIEQEDKKTTTTVKPSDIKGKSTANNCKGRTMKDPFFEHNCDLLNSMNDYGDVIKKNVTRSVDELEQVVHQMHHCRSPKSPLQTPPPGGEEEAADDEDDDMFGSDDRDYLVPSTKWSYETPPDQRIKPFILQPTERKPYLWLGGGDDDAQAAALKGKTKNTFKSKKKLEVDVVNNGLSMKNSNGLYEFSVDVKKYSKCKVVNLDAHCKPVFKIINKKINDEVTVKKFIFSNDNDDETSCDAPYDQPDALCQFLAATQRRPEKQKRQVSMYDMFPKKLSFSSPKGGGDTGPVLYDGAKTIKRQKTDECDTTTSNDLGCDLIASPEPPLFGNRNTICDTRRAALKATVSCTMSKRDWLLGQQKHKNLNLQYPSEDAFYPSGGIPGYELAALQPLKENSYMNCKVFGREAPLYDANGVSGVEKADLFHAFRGSSASTGKKSNDRRFFRFDSCNLNESFEGGMHEPSGLNRGECTPRMKFLERGLKNMAACEDDAINNSSCFIDEDCCAFGAAERSATVVGANFGDKSAQMSFRMDFHGNANKDCSANNQRLF